jgi:nicotinamide-nucleotide amidase
VDIGVFSPTGSGSSATLKELAAELEARLGLVVYTTDRRELPEVIQRILAERGLTLSVAESCTGGLLGAQITDQAGSSATFTGGVIVYADRTKADWLGVPEATLTTHGAVSQQTATAMAIGCRKRFGTDYALAVTGIAGPGGGTPTKPVGTTWIAAATPQAVHSARYRFPGQRHRVRRLAVAAALDTLRRILQTGDEIPPWLPGDSFRREP